MASLLERKQGRLPQEPSPLSLDFGLTGIHQNQILAQEEQHVAPFLFTKWQRDGGDLQGGALTQAGLKCCHSARAVSKVWRRCLEANDNNGAGLSVSSDQPSNHFNKTDSRKTTAKTPWEERAILRIPRAVADTPLPISSRGS